MRPRRTIDWFGIESNLSCYPGIRGRANGAVCIGVGQHGPPPKIDLHEPRSAAQVLEEIVNIRSAQARFSDCPLQDALILKCQCGRNHRSSSPLFERLQQLAGSTQAGAEGGNQNVRVNDDAKHS